MDPDRQSHRIQQSSQPPSRDHTPAPARTSSTVPSTPAPSMPELNEEEIERKATLIAEEYLCNNNNFAVSINIFFSMIVSDYIRF